MRYRTNIIRTDRPIVELNTTPLIDVMLVLLVMFIMVAPAATHKVAVDLPNGSGSSTEPPPVNRIDVFANGAISWNGKGVSDADFRGKLAIHVADELRPELHVAAEGTGSYDRFHWAMTQIKQAGVTRLGFIGNDRYREL